MNFINKVKNATKNILPKRVLSIGRKVYHFVKGRIVRPELYNSHTPERIGVAYAAPSDMRIEDRLFLYSFIRGVKPRRALEAGILKGGSALIISSAMEDNGIGQLVGIDPTPEVELNSRKFFGRFKIIKEPSPQAIPQAVEILGGSLDFVLIDDIHIYSQVYSELNSVLPYMAEEGYILLHDAFNYGVHAAIEKFLEETENVQDCGLMTISPQLCHDPWTPYGGLRILRMIPEKSYVMDIIKECYKAEGLEQPDFTQDVLDHDKWYCQTIKPCPRCRNSI